MLKQIIIAGAALGLLSACGPAPYDNDPRNAHGHPHHSQNYHDHDRDGIADRYEDDRYEADRCFREHYTNGSYHRDYYPCDVRYYDYNNNQATDRNSLNRNNPRNLHDGPGARYKSCPPAQAQKGLC